MASDRILRLLLRLPADAGSLCAVRRGRPAPTPTVAPPAVSELATRGSGATVGSILARVAAALLVAGAAALAEVRPAGGVITPAGGNTGISADTAADGSAPAYTSITITLAEGAGANGDINTGGSSKTIVIGAPAGWTFDPTAADSSVSYTAGKNITAASIGSASSSSITVNVTTGGTNKSDTLTITVPVRATTGATLPDTGWITKTGGTATVNLSTTNLAQVGLVAGAASKLTVTGSAAQTAGTSQTVTVTAQDSFGHTDTAYSSSPSVTFGGASVAPSSTSPTFAGTSFGTAAALSFTNGVATGAMVLYKAETASVTATAAGLSAGTPLSVTVAPGAAASLSLGSASTAFTAGVSQTTTVTALDTWGNTATGYTGSHSIVFGGASLSPNLTRPTFAGTSFGTGTSLTFTNGAASGAMILTKVESPSITATDGAIGTGPGYGVVVGPGAPAGFTFSLASPQAVAASFTGSNTLTAIDVDGNTVTGFNAATDNVTITNSPAGGTVSGLSGGNKLIAAGDFVGGVANLTSLGLEWTGTAGSHTFTATSAGGKSGTSGSVTLNAGAATTFAIGGSGAQTAGGSQALTITAKDAGGNTAVGYAGDKSLTFSGASSSPGPATAPTVTDRSGSAVAFGSATTITFASGVSSAGGSMTLYKAQSASIGVTDGTVTTPSPLAVTVSAGALAKFAVSLASPQTVASSFSGSNTLTAQDAYGNTVTGFNASTDNVTLTSSPAGGAISGLSGGNKLTAAGDFAGGVANLTSLGLEWTGTAGIYTFTATSASGKTGTSGDVTFSPGTATTFTIGGSANQTAGGAQALTITAKDAGGNTATGYTGDKSLTFSGAAASPNANNPTVTDKTGAPVAFGSATTITFANGVASAGGAVKLYRAENASVAATDGTVTTPTPLAVAVSPAGLQSFTLGLAGTETNGLAFSGTNTLTAKDAYGNVATGFDASADNVTITSSLGGTVSGLSGSAKLTAAADFSDGIANLTALGLKYTGTSGWGTFTATSASGKTGTSGSVAINPGAADHFAITGSATQTAGGSQALTVTAYDASGNVATSYSGDHSLTFSGAGAAPNAAQPTVTDRAGSAVDLGTATTITFASGVSSAGGSVTLYRAETAALAVTDGAVSRASPLSVAVSPASLARFSLQLASPQANATAFTGTDTLTAQDAYGNTVTSFGALADPVTLTTTLPGTIGGLAGAGNVLNRPGDFTGGVADLSALGLEVTGPTGTGTFTATSSTGKTGTSGPVTVGSGAAASFTVTAPGTAAQNVSQTVTVTAKDVSGNLATGYTGTVHLTSSDAQATLPSDYAFVAGDGGTHDFAVTFKTAAAQTVTATDTGNGSIAGTSGAVDVTGAASIAVSAPASATAGSPVSVTVTVEDSHGATATGYLGTVHFTSTDARAALPADYTFTAGDAGTHTFTATLKTAGSRAITVTDTGNSTVTGTSSGTTVSPAAAAKLVFTSSTADLAGQSSRTLTVEVRDAYGNLESGDDSTSVTFAKSSGAGTVSGLGAATASAGVASKSVTGQVAGAVAIDATAGGLAGDTSSFSVVAGPADHFALAGSGSQTAGGAQALTITAQDAAGNTATGYAGDHALTFSGASPSPGPVTAPTVTDAGGSPVQLGTATTIAFTNGVSSAGGSLVLYDGESASIGVTDGAISASTPLAVAVSPAPLARLSLDLASPQTNAAPFAGTDTLTARDAYGNTVTSFSALADPVTLTTTLPGTIGGLGGAGNVLNRVGDFVGGVANLGSLGLTYTGTAGTGTFTATAQTGESATSGSIAIGAGAATKLAVASVNGGSNPTAGSAFSVVVRPLDVSDNVSRVAADTDVTLAVGTGTGTLGGATSGTIAAGQSSATIPGVTYTKAETGVTLTATRTGGDALAAATSAAFTVDPGAADHFGISGSATQTAGATQTLTITAYDAEGNVATSYTGSHALLFSGAAASPGSAAPTVTDAGGTAVAFGSATPITFANGISSAGGSLALYDVETANVAAADGALSTPAPLAVAVAPASASTLRLAAGAAETAGSSFSVGVTAYDPYGNTASGYRGTVHLTSGDLQAVLPADYAFTAGDAGAHTFSATLKTAGAQSVAATDTGDATVTGSTGAIAVSPATAAQLVFTSATTSLASGAPRTLTAEVRDAYGNLERGDNSTAVTFAKSAGAGTVTGLGSATASDGVASQTVTGQLAGAISIDATATGLAADASGFAIVPGAADHLTFTSSTADLASGSTRTLTAEIRDAAGNLVTGDDSTSVAFAKSGGTGTLTGLGAATAGGGVASEDVGGALAGAITLSASASGITGDAETFTIVPGPADRLTFTSSTTDLASGSTRTLTAEIRDAAGNLVTGDDSTSVAFAKSGGTGTLAGLGAVTVGGGVASETVTAVLAGAITLSASATGLGGDTQSFAVVAGAADHLALTSSGADLASGASRTLTAEIRDAAGNLVTGDGSTSVTFAQTGGAGSLGGLGAATAAGGVASETVTGELAGGVTLDASATGLDGDTQSLAVVPGAPDHLTFTSSVASLTSGSSRTLTAEVRDAAGNLVASDGSTAVTFAKSGGSGTLTGLGAATASGGLASKTVSAQLAGAITVDAAATGLAADSASFTIDPGPAVSLAVAAPGSITAGTPVGVTVTAHDAAGNAATGYTGTVHLTSTDTRAALPSDYAFGAGDAGTHDFSVTLKTRGMQTVTATDAGDGTLTATSGGIDVSTDVPSTATSTITPADGTLTADGTSTTTLTVRLEDQFGNDVGASGGTVALATTKGTLSAVTDNGDGTYTATLTAPTSAGTATIGGTLDGSALAHTAQVDFAAGPAAQYVVTASSASPTVGTAVTITAQLADAQGNPVATAGRVVTWSKTGAGGSFGSPTSTTNAAGVATIGFTTSTTAGTAYAVTGDDGTDGGTSATFTTVPAPPDHYAVTAAPASPAAGDTVAVAAQLEDVYGNAVPIASLTVGWSKTGAGGSFASASTQTDASGRASVAFTTAATAGTTYTVTGDDGTHSGATPGFTTVAGPADAARSSVAAGAGTLAADGSASTTITVTVRDANDNPIAGAGVSLGQGSASSDVTPSSATTNATGVATFAVDDAYAEHVVYTATAGSTTITQTAAVDFAPDTTLTGEPADPSDAAGPVFSFSSGSLGTGFECSLDGAAYASCSSPDTLAGLADGSHTFDVRATGPGVADPTPAHYAWTVDLTPPSVTLTAPADGSVVNGTVTIGATATDDDDPSPAVAYEFRAGGASSWTATGASWDTGSLADGSYDVRAVATDAAGNSQASAIATVRVDNHAPSVTTTPPRYVNAADGGTVTVSATTPDGDVAKVDFYDCPTTDPTCTNRIGTATSAPFDASWDESGDAEGDRVIRAVATDLGGLTGFDTRTVTIDRTAPAGVTISYAGGWNTSGSVSISTTNGSDAGSGLDLASATLLRQTGDVQSDGSCAAYGAFAPVSGSPDTVPDGTCAVYRWSIADAAGNATTVDGPEVRVDETAPTTTITSEPGDPDDQATPTFAFSASEYATFECKVDTGSWQVCASPTQLTTLGDGPHTFSVRGTDRAGNVEQAPPSYAWTVDTVPPAASMVTPASYVRGTVGLVSNSTDSGGSGIVTTQFQVSPAGAGSWSDVPSNFDTTSVADGLYDFHVIVVDRAGNVGTSAPVQNIRVDNTKPSVSVTAPAASSAVKDTVALAASTSDADPSPSVVFELAPQGTSSWTTVPASWNTKTVADGEYQLRATATDWAGNVQTSAVVDHVLVDNRPPTVSLDAPADGDYVNAASADPYTLKATATDAGSGVTDVQFFACSTSDCTGGTLTPLGTVAAPGPYQADWPIPADGVHGVEAVAHDGAGHASTAVSTVTVDRTPPETTILTKPGDPTNDPAPSFTFGSDDATASFECRLDGAAWSPCTSPWTPASTPADGTHTVDIRAIDPAGNADPSPDTWTWLEDRTPPDATMDDPAAANAAHAILGTIELTSTESDPGGAAASGVDTVTYEYCDTTRDCTDPASWAALPVNTATWDTTAIEDGIYDLHVVVTDRAGNSTTSAEVASVKVDNTVPQSAQDDPGAYLRQTLTLSGTAADPQDPAGNDGSGIDRVEFQVSPAGVGSWTTIGSAAGLAGPYSTSYDTTSGATPDGVYDFRTIAYDRAGNAEPDSTAVGGRMVDNTAPTATMTDPGHFLRATVHLASTTDDPLTNGVASGVAQVTYEYANESDGVWHQTPAGWDTTALPDGTYDVRVTANDRAGNSTTSSPVTGLVVDNTKPVTTDDAPGGWQAGGVTVHLSASDSGSGVNTTEYSLDGGAWIAGTSASVPAVDGSHTVSYFSADNAGNVEAVKTAVVLVDTTPPACPSCSASDYYRGTVTLSATPTSGPSPITSVKFQSSADGSSWATIGTDATATAGTYSVQWDTAEYADGGYYLRVAITNEAGTTSYVDLHGGTVVVVDNTAPTASIGAPVAGEVVSGTITIAAVAHDANDLTYSFAVDGVTIANTTSPTTTWNTTTHGDGNVSITVTATDPAGNSTTSSAHTITVDNTAPSPTLADPGAAVRGTISLSASSDGDTQTVEFQRSPAGAGTWTTIATVGAPFSTTLDTTALADGLYDLRAVATDGSGHVGTSPARTTRVDNTPPTATLTAPADGRTIGGPDAALAATASDSGSGVASVEFQYSPAGTGTWQTIGSTSTTPYQLSWDATDIATGDYDLHLVVTDVAGNSRTTTSVGVHVDSTPPTVTLQDPGARLAGPVTLTATAGASADHVVFEVSPAGANSWTTIGTDGSSPWSQSFDTSSVPDGLYDLRATAYDAYDNSASSLVAGIRIDNSAPSLVASVPADGATVTSASSIELTASEAVTAPGTTLDGRAVAAPVIVGNRLTFNTGTLGNGLHTLAGNLRDAVGNTTPFLVHFTVASGSSAPAPTAGNTKPGQASTVTSADGTVQVTVPPGAWRSTTGDWLVVTIAPATPPSGLTGLDVVSSAYDIGARWALSGSAVHSFDAPLEIVFHGAPEGAIPATSDGAWRLLAPVPQPGQLPAAWDDGYFVSGGDVHVLTRHLTPFALVRDSAPPTPPTGFTGRVQDANLVLEWAPGTDNSGVVAGYQVYVDGASQATLPAAQTSWSAGPYDPNDAHVYTVSESDAAGNLSAQTKQLAVVPALDGLTVDQARAALDARGFDLGELTRVESSRPAGTVVGPADLVLAELGAPLDLDVSTGLGDGRAGAKLAFSVVATKQFSWKARRYLGARVKSTRAVSLAVDLRGADGELLHTWRLHVKAGIRILKLRMPQQVRRSGSYALAWTARAGSSTVRRTVPLRIGPQRLSQPSQVVLDGDALPAALAGPRTISAAGGAAFDVTGDPRANVQVIVVDADEYGLGLVHDLNTVFPGVRIVALSDDPARLSRAVAAGASLALPRRTPPKRLQALIAELARKPKY